MTADCILIRELKVRGTLGIEEQERRTPQAILISLWLYGDFREAGESDRIEQTVNYHTVAQRITQHIETSRRYTVEALATDIARILCDEYPRLERIRVRLEKPEAVPTSQSVGIEIERSRADFA